MGRIIPHIMENKKCSKPPISSPFEKKDFPYEIPLKFPDVPKFSAPLRLTAFSKDGARQDSGRGSAIPCHVVRLAGNLGKKFMMR